MIRAAKSVDTHALVGLLSDVHAETCYASLKMDEHFARRLFAQMAQRHGGSHEGSTCLFISEEDGKPNGFIAGMLDRVYHVGEMLWASDVYLHVSKGAPPRVLMGLLKAYTQWADNNPNVYEVRLSSSDATTQGQRMDGVYEWLGFEECGRTYRRVCKRPVSVDKAGSTTA